MSLLVQHKSCLFWDHQAVLHAFTQAVLGAEIAQTKMAVLQILEVAWVSLYAGLQATATP